MPGWYHLATFLERYWKTYGGFRTLIKSPYLHVSIPITILTHPAWRRSEWWEIVLSTHPAVIGFSVAGLSFILSFGLNGGPFSRLISRSKQADEDPLKSPIAGYGAIFIHFILMQFIALTLAIISKVASGIVAPSWCDFLYSDTFRNIFWGICVFFSIYSMLMLLAVVEILFSVLRLSVLHNKMAEKAERLESALKNESEKP